MITLDDFTRKIEAEFEEISPGTLTPDTQYRSIESWSSMHALIIIAFFDSNFNIALTGADLKSAQSIRDLYAIVQQKQNQ